MTRPSSGGATASRRRLAAVPALVGLALLLTAPLRPAPAGATTTAAAAEGALTVQIDAPSGTITDDGGVTVSGKVTAGFGAEVETIRVMVVRDADGATVLDKTVCCSPAKSDSIPFSATTASLSVNGSYSVHVGAAGSIVLLHIPVDPASASGSFKMAVPPAAPGNTKVTVQGDRSVIVSWSAAPAYADFVGYAVYRKTGSAPFQAVKGIEDRTTTSFHDTSLNTFSGPIQYQVASIRGVKGDESTWLISTGDPAAATVPPPPTTTPPVTGPDGQTTTTTPGGGLQQGGAASTDLGGFFSSQPQPIPVPPTSPPPTFPDTGYTETLPFGALPTTTDDADTVGGRSGASSGAVDGGQLAGVNRRALLVPIAAGSVLCVAALHLRWLNRRLAIPVAAAGGPATGSPAGGDLEVDPSGAGETAFRPGGSPGSGGGPGNAAKSAKEPVGASW